MFRMCLGQDMDMFTITEEESVERLVSARWQLMMDGDRVNTKSEDGSRACAAYLDVLDTVARSMRLEKAPRRYRDSFTVNYRALFPDEARNYRVDVLEASFEQYAVIWVNGDKFEFSAEAMRRAEELQRTWWQLGLVLERWSEEGPHWHVRPTRPEVRSTLVALDFAWASFEEKYISELIDIEDKARRLIVKAIDHDRGVSLLEAYHGETAALLKPPEYLEEQKRLVASIAHLNSVANVRRKGRDDLKVEVYFDAVATLYRCDMAERAGESEEELLAARLLATDIVKSYAAMREYLREVEHCLERVDPHLCNNVRLVARLVEWEESWEMGTRYMQNETSLNAICDLVAAIRRAQRVAPSLVAMCEECDVEFFMVLPRIIWLRFLAKPSEHLDLLKSFLPHRFVGGAGEKGATQGAAQGWDPELRDFLGSYQLTRTVLAASRAVKTSASTEDQAIWEMLMKRVVHGSGREAQDAPNHEVIGPEAEAAIEDLMRRLEGWSMELQRHCPEDWNQCSAILVQCLTRGGERQARRDAKPEGDVTLRAKV
jgi:hypothetical protein